MKDDTALDVSGLPSFGYGQQSLMWWATWGLMLIEGTVFAMAVVMYFYLRAQAPAWPLGAPPPDAGWATLNVGVLLLSMLPNALAQRAALRRDRPAARRWLWVCMAFALVFLALRVQEFKGLNIAWHQNAYGSLVWLILGLHTTHLVTDTLDTAVLAVLFCTGPFESRRFVSVSENALYWYFVVGSWLPLYVVVYGVPRL